LLRRIARATRKSTSSPSTRKTSHTRKSV
jgi:hypothetical protein